MFMARADIHNLNRWHRLASRSGFRADALAANMKISLRTLERYCREAFGCSVRTWLTQRRLAPAKRQLKVLRRVKDAAYAIGFKQPSHFTREFKKLYGLTPADFIEGAGGHETHSRPPSLPPPRGS
jgi:AraC-like DNA-binding protein